MALVLLHEILLRTWYMLIDAAYFLMLVLALSGMVSMTAFGKTRVEHILFAIFCGSLAMVAIRTLSADILGPYQYLIALGTCATCNVIWLISIALFREENSLSRVHYLVAASIASLVVISYSVELMLSMAWVSSGSVAWLDRSVSELSGMLSSTVLVLTFWEALRGYSKATRPQQQQRKLFAGTFFAGVFSCSVIGRGMLPESAFPEVFPWLVVISASSIICVTFLVLLSQHRHRQGELQTVIQTDEMLPEESDKRVLEDIERLMREEKLFLQAELKMIDLANRLRVSEYKISRAVRHVSSSPNFNHFINAYRLDHATKLLVAPDSCSWTILVIALESGFASLASFNRAFKASFHCTPGQYRSRSMSLLPADTCSSATH